MYSGFGKNDGSIVGVGAGLQKLNNFGDDNLADVCGSSR